MAFQASLNVTYACIICPRNVVLLASTFTRLNRDLSGHALQASETWFFERPSSTLFSRMVNWWLCVEQNALLYCCWGDLSGFEFCSVAYAQWKECWIFKTIFFKVINILFEVFTSYLCDTLSFMKWFSNCHNHQGTSLGDILLVYDF